MKVSIPILAASLLALSLVACDAQDATTPETQTTIPSESGIAVAQWQQQGSTAFEQAAANWQQSLIELEQAPSEDTLGALREALSSWYRIFTGQSLLLHARACQLDQSALLARMDSWPLYPGYIDAMPEWPESGLISDPYLEMDRKTLRTQHGATDSAEASLGFAAMFVVLNGSGNDPKPLAHFQGDENNAARRLTYLTLAGEQLLADYQTLTTTEIALLSGDLNCALSVLIAQQEQLAIENDSDSELVVPQTVRKTINDILPGKLMDMPESVASAWETAQPGILDAITASKKEGWAAISDWQESLPE